MITAQAEEARKLYEQISIWTRSDEVKLMPEADALPYERIVSDLPTELERLRVLSALANAHQREKSAAGNNPGHGIDSENGFI